MVSSLLLLLVLPDVRPAQPSVAARIDTCLEQHWQANGVRPAAPADAAVLRRLTLDLAGRIPTVREARAFADDRAPHQRARTIRRLMNGPEYALHLGRVLDDFIQGKHAGDADFLEYLRDSVAGHKPWDQVFREVLLGPWDSPPRKRADRFLAKRVGSLDDLTNDTARVFFGVNVSCAKCHDHPLVPDWTQDHYFGLASFFNPTYEAGKAKGKNAAVVAEKATAEVVFVTTKGDKRTAKTMFLSGRVVAADAAAARREQLVRVALEEKQFFSRAIVNRLWAYFVGRGLVQPLDQMHAANRPVVPGLLEWLADDLAAHGYDLDRLVAGILSSRVYQLAGTRPGDGDDPADRLFARAPLRPLSPQQYALSLLLATGDDNFDGAAEPEARRNRYRELEAQAAALTKPDLLDRPGEKFQSSTGEALFLSNHAEVQRLLEPAGNNLVARLAVLEDTNKVVDAAVWAVLSRLPKADERAYLVRWLEERQETRARACGQLVWALMTSAEFRFNH